MCGKLRATHPPSLLYYHPISRDTSLAYYAPSLYPLPPSAVSLILLAPLLPAPLHDPA